MINGTVLFTEGLAIDSYAEIFVQVGITAGEMFYMSIDQYFRPGDTQLTRNRVMRDLWPAFLQFHDNIIKHAHGEEELHICSRVWLDRNIGKLRRMLKSRY